jgi:hypothetical protein
MAILTVNNNTPAHTTRPVRTVANAWTEDYEWLSMRDAELLRKKQARNIMMNSLQRHMSRSGVNAAKENGDSRMEKCRYALRVLDANGWKRSHHQQLFHNAYIKAVTRVFFKLDSEGSFERAHQRLLQVNGWSHIQSEVLISTPRRFGKTISVSMYAVEPYLNLKP